MARLKKLWGIRHMRWAWRRYQVHAHAARWASIGIGLGAPNAYDLEVLDQIWRGEA